MLESITPLIITLDEVENIERTVDGVRWARDIVVVDSGSTDGTLEILQREERVRLLSRRFDTFADQCAYGLSAGEIETEWVLSLDADHLVTPELTEELRGLRGSERAVDGFVARFVYSVYGRRLRTSLYPPRVVLFRRDRGRFVNHGHGHRIEVEGTVDRLRSPLVHDDRKPLSRWLRAQRRYAEIEAEYLENTSRSRLNLADRLRKRIILAPLAVPLYCLLVRGGLLDGWAGWHYAFQRSAAEVILSLSLIERKIRRGSGPGGNEGRNR